MERMGGRRVARLGAAALASVGASIGVPTAAISLHALATREAEVKALTPRGAAGPARSERR